MLSNFEGHILYSRYFGILKTQLNVFQLNFVVSVSDNVLHSGMNLILL